MDPSQWRNPALNSLGSAIQRLDPYIISEEPGLSTHSNLAESGQVPTSSGTSSLIGPYKPTAFSQFVFDATRLKEQDHQELGISPHKSIFTQEDNLRNQGQLHLPQTSPNIFGGIAEELSPPSQRFFPPPAHQGFHQTSVQSAPSHQPTSPFFSSAIADRSEVYLREPFSIRENSVLSVEARQEPIFRRSETLNSFHSSCVSSQQYLDSLKQSTDFEIDKLSPVFEREKRVNFIGSSFTSQPYSGAENFCLPIASTIPSTNFSSDHLRGTCNQQQSLAGVITEPYISKRTSETIQAVADSTTKPKKGRGRKKKESLTEVHKEDQEKKIVKRFIEQEQQLQQFANNQGRNNIYPSTSQMTSNVYGHSYNTSLNVRGSFDMQGSQISSTKNTDLSFGQSSTPSSGIDSYTSNSAKHLPPMTTNYNCSDTLMGMESMGQRNVNDSPYRNSPIQQEHFSPQGISIPGNTNNFMTQGNLHGFSDGSIPNINSSGQSRIMDSSNYSYTVPSNQPSFVDQLNSSEFDALEMEPVAYSGGSNLCNLETYNSYGQPVSQQNDFCANPHNNPSSTVDETALSNLISNNPQGGRQNQQDKYYYSAEYIEKSFVTVPVSQSTAIVNPIDEDDEFEHLKKPPVIEKRAQTNVVPQTSANKSYVSHNNVARTPVSQTNVQSMSVSLTYGTKATVPEKTWSEPQAQVTTEPDQPPTKLPEKPQGKTNKNNAFMDSFLSFLQGKKPETLSSVNNSVVKKPELPKYYPEQKQPRQASVEKNTDSASSTPKLETDNRSGYTSPSNDDTASTKIAASDEEANNKVTGTVKNIETGNEQHPSLKMRITLQKSQPKQKKVKTKIPKSTGKAKRSRSFRENDEDQAFSSGEDNISRTSNAEHPEQMPSPVPKRRASARKAKEKSQQKKYKDSDSELEEEVIPEIYDSDSDPAWTPFAGEKKEPYVDDVYGSQRKGCARSNRLKGKLKRAVKPSKSPSNKVPRVAYPSQPSTPESSEEEAEEYSTTQNRMAFVMGTFVINKQDLNNFEGFPIWRIESGKMMRKYELFVDKGEIFHKSLSTYSSWLPNMEKNYVPLRMTTIPHSRISLKDNQHVVQVVEEDRPKPKLDSSKETEYEKDPLADMFNVYLQVFLSQAMESTFLNAIHDNEEEFYLKPLKMIDEIISKKLVEINSKVRWTSDFKAIIEKRPHIREIERTNLKAMCQATKNSTQNANKSVHLFGQSYNRTTLQENPEKFANQGSLEYLIGKTASNYISDYHSLHHFKYNLYKRCLAKVDIVREGNTKLDNAEILDKCLNNRTWVLKIFDDLKRMLEKG